MLISFLARIKTSAGDESDFCYCTPSFCLCYKNKEETIQKINLAKSKAGEFFGFD